MGGGEGGLALDGLFGREAEEEAAKAAAAAEEEEDAKAAAQGRAIMRTAICGAPSIRTWAWVALRPGLYVVRGEYKRSWEQSRAPLREVEFAVKVE